MPAPTAYTEASLKAWLAIELGNIGSLLGWDAAHAQIAQAVTDTERLLGVSDVASEADAAKIERVAAVAGWRRCLKGVAALYTVSEDQQKFDRSDLLKQVQAALSLAESAAAGDGVLAEYSISVDNVVRPAGDPFQWYPDESRTVVTP